MNATRLTVLPAAAILALGLPLPSGHGAPTGDADAIVSASSATLASFDVDPVHSWVLFRTTHLGIGAAYGSFAKFSGSIEYDAGDITKSKIDLTIDASSIQTNSEDRDKHLRSQDFFNVKQYPEIRFTSTKVEAGGGDEFQVSGTLSLHGVEKEITATVRKIGEGEFHGSRVGFEAEFEIDRTDFGMDYMAQGLGPAVDVIVAVETVKK